MPISSRSRWGSEHCTLSTFEVMARVSRIKGYKPPPHIREDVDGSLIVHITQDANFLARNPLYLK